MLRVYSHSLGCPKNRVDTERLLGSLGVEIEAVAEPEDAQLVLINTCSFIGPAVEESVQAVVQMAADLDGLDSRPLLAVAGCLVGRYGKAELAPEIPEVDLWLPSADLQAWPDLLRQALHLPDSKPGRLLSTGPAYAWLKISEGCRHSCAFCTIPSFRGPLISLPEDFLTEEAKGLLDQGVREIILVAQDVSAWGWDFSKGQPEGSSKNKDLRHLLDRLLPLPGLDRLRLMYLYPSGMTDDLLRYLSQAPANFMPYFDMPLQHAAEPVLRRMGRPFAQDPQLVVDRIRSYFPDAALRTTMMVGFPGETAADFDTLMAFAARNRFQHLGVFAFQPEAGTPAADMPNQIPDKIKEERREALLSLQQEISEEILDGYLGQSLDILVEKTHDEWPGLHTGRAWFQAPEVDGLTYISGQGVEPGAIVRADIVDTSHYDLIALA